LHGAGDETDSAENCKTNQDTSESAGGLSNEALCTLGLALGVQQWTATVGTSIFTCGTDAGHVPEFTQVECALCI